MSNPIPDLLALTSIADGSQRLASPLRNNYAAIQAAFNELVAALGGGSAGQVLEAVDATHVQWATTTQELGKTAFTATVTVSATVEAAPTTIVTAPAVTLDGVTPIKVEFFAPSITCPSAAAGRVIISLWEGATQLGRIWYFGSDAAGNALAGAKAEYEFTPAAGTHTYFVAAHRVVADMSINVGPGGVGTYVPGFIRIARAA